MITKCKVVFGNSMNPVPYTYFTDLELKLGDYVVVDSKNRLGFARVMEINTKDEENRATSWVLDRIDVPLCRERIRMSKTLNQVN